VPVPETYAHGVILGCQTCKSQLRLLRNEKGVLRLVIADAAPLRDQVAFNRAHVDKLQADLRVARHSLGVGTNGFGVGVIYMVARLAREDRVLNMQLLTEAVIIALVVGVLLEAANYFFLAKRKTMTRLAIEIDQMRDEQQMLQSLIRDAERAQQQLTAPPSRTAGG
jgi:hypothetical protein